MTPAEAKAIREKNLAKGKPLVPVVEYTGFGTFTVLGKKYSAEGIALSWTGKQSWAGFDSSSEWTVTFPDGSQLVFDPQSDLAKDGSHEVLTQSAFPD